MEAHDYGSCYRIAAKICYYYEMDRRKNITVNFLVFCSNAPKVNSKRIYSSRKFKSSANEKSTSVLTTITITKKVHTSNVD